MLRDTRDIIRRLEREGFVHVSIAGSHHKYRHPASGRTVIVAHPRKNTPSRYGAIHLQTGRLAEGLNVKTHYIVLIHKEPDSGYGVSFPDVPGVTTVGDTLEEALEQAADVLQFAFEDWPGSRPVPRTLDELRADPEFLEDSADAVVAAVAPKESFSAVA